MSRLRRTTQKVKQARQPKIEPITKSAREIVEAENQELQQRSAACKAECDLVLAKHRCVLSTRGEFIHNQIQVGVMYIALPPENSNG